MNNEVVIPEQSLNLVRLLATSDYGAVKRAVYKGLGCHAYEVGDLLVIDGARFTVTNIDAMSGHLLIEQRPPR